MDAMSAFFTAWNISDTALQARARQLFSVSFVKKGTILYRPGQWITEMVFIASPGFIRGYIINADGKEIMDCITNTVGECISPDYPPDHNPIISESWIQVLTDLNIIKITLENLKILCNEFPEVSDIQKMMLEKHMCNFRSIKRMVNGRTSAAERVKWFYRTYKDITKYKIPDKYIAPFLGMTEVSLCNKRKELGIKI